MKRFVVASLISTLAASGVACSDRTAPDPVVTVEPVGVVVSASMQAPLVSGSAGEVAYVSIAPQTYPGAVSFEIANHAGGAAQSFAATDGGLDPVAIPAHAGDIVNITVRTASGVPTSLALNVPVRRPPVVVRTNPAKGRVDVALNVNVSVVFSEPIEPKTLDSASLQLLHDGAPTGGTLRLSENALTAEFTPANSLLPLATYELLVTQRIRDIVGDSLAASYSSTFTTCPNDALPSSCPQFPTGGIVEITGVVSERTPQGSSPFAHAIVYAWVLDANGRGYSGGVVGSDANGHFRFNVLQNTTVLIHNTQAGYDQPCGLTTRVTDQGAVANIELVSQSHPILEVATTPPLITGVVYEVTPTGRQPVAGARISYDAALDLIEATTTTNENGRYAICNLPALYKNGTVYAAKDGYVMAEETVSLLLAAQQLDIELKPKQ